MAQVLHPHLHQGPLQHQHQAATLMEMHVVVNGLMNATVLATADGAGLQMTLRSGTQKMLSVDASEFISLLSFVKLVVYMTF